MNFIEAVGNDVETVKRNKTLIETMIQRGGQTGYFVEPKPPAGLKHIGSGLIEGECRHYYYNENEDKFYDVTERELRFRQQMLAAEKRIKKKKKR